MQNCCGSGSCRPPGARGPHCNTEICSKLAGINECSVEAAVQPAVLTEDHVPADKVPGLALNPDVAIPPGRKLHDGCAHDAAPRKRCSSRATASQRGIQVEVSGLSAADETDKNNIA